VDEEGSLLFLLQIWTVATNNKDLLVTYPPLSILSPVFPSFPSFSKDYAQSEDMSEISKPCYAFVSTGFAFFTLTHPMPNAATNAAAEAPAERN
jgi:hypothetical protein